MAILSVKAAGWLHTAVEAANVGLCGPWRKASNGGAVQKFMAWVADGLANTFTVDNLTKITRLTRTDWQGTVALSPSPRTSLFLQSADIANVSWTKFGSSVTADSATAPDGTTTADTLVEDAANSSHYINKAYSFGDGIYTRSVYLKAKERTWARVRMGLASAYVNLATGQLGTVDVGTVAITVLPNGWVRVALTATMGAGAANTFVHIATSNGGSTYQGDNASGIYVWGNQLETGSVATSYIPTTTAPVTVTDYALASEDITLGETPVAGAVFTLDGDITADVEGA